MKRGYAVSLIALAMCLVELHATCGRAQHEMQFSDLQLYVMQATSSRNVQAELKLTDEQRARMVEIQTSVTKSMQSAIEAQRKNAGASPNGSEFEKAIAEAATTIRRVLSPDQAARLDQIHLQSRGVKALLIPAVASELKITDLQKSQLREIDSKYSGQRRALRDNPGSPQRKPSMTGRQITTDAMREAAAVLTPPQREVFEKMRGAEFDFYRRVPPAPAAK